MAKELYVDENEIVTNLSLGETDTKNHQRVLLRELET